MEKTAVVPGSFDPVTLGHYYLVCEAARVFDRVVVALMDNVEKRYLFSASDREAFCRRAFSEIGNVSVLRFEGTLAAACQETHASVIVKGVRNSIDFEYEYDYFIGNKILTGGLHTFFVPSDPALRHVSSSAVRELLKIGASLSGYVPDNMESCLLDCYHKDIKKV